MSICYTLSLRFISVSPTAMMREQYVRRGILLTATPVPARDSAP